jgi:hypothetical protein
VVPSADPFSRPGVSRILFYPKYGYSIEQDVQPTVHDAYQRLITAGYDARVVKD